MREKEQIKGEVNYSKMVEVSGGDDRGPCGAGIFDDGSGHGFVGVYEIFFVFTPCCSR